MSKPLDNEHVSGALPAFLDGTLDSADAASVEEHLSACEECAQEAAGLKFLRAPSEGGLTSSERTALEHRVMAGIAEDPSEAPVVELRPRKSVGARVAQVLGAAAAIAVFGTLLYMGSTIGGGDGADESAGTALEAENGDREGRRNGDRNRSRPAAIAADSAASKEESTAATAGDASGGAGSSFKGAPDPRFEVAEDPYTSADLQKLGESSLASVTFASYYSADDAEGRYTLLEELVAAAEATSGSTVSSQVEECGSQVLDTEDPTIPTFGAIGELDGETALVLGFAWTRTRSGPLDRYMVWAWEKGSCSATLDFVDGRIETAD